MNLGKLFKFGKKGAKVASKAGKKGSVAPQSPWPAGTRIGVFGHENSGKTVYFTVLNEESKISKNLQISVTDNDTAGEFLANYRAIWGLGTSGEAGTVVDFQGEKKFPDPTRTDKTLLFNAILDRNTKLSVVSLDYSGKAVSISEHGSDSEKIYDFMVGCDGLLFFYDPKIMGAELESQARIASFINLLEQLAPLKARLPIPIGLVITKADILPGFSGDDQTVLVDDENEYLMSEDFELFLERILESNKVASNSAWAGTVRSVLIKLKDFLRVVLGRTLDFQIFFTSCTGQEPEKIGTDVGRSIYAPPKKMQPIGVKQPMYWLLNAIVRNKKVSRVRQIAKLVTAISLIWIVLFSIPYVIHFSFLHPRPAKVESEVLETAGGNIYNASSKARDRIVKAYRGYERNIVTRWFFSPFLAPAQRLREGFAGYNKKEAEQNLDMQIAKLTSIVRDSTLWPTMNPSDSTVILGDEHEKLVSALESYRSGDETSKLYSRADRVLVYWELFTRSIIDPNDTTIWRTMHEQVQTNQSLYGNELSRAEIELGEALTAGKQKTVKKVVAKKAATELGDLISRVNSNPDPKYRIEDAVDELKKLRSSLDPNIDAASISMIDRYIRRAQNWNSDRTYAYTIESIEGDGHLHVEVTSRGSDPAWSEQNQLIAGLKQKIEWKLGDQIHIALDTLRAAENWGKTASDKVFLNDRYSLFDMEGKISFDRVGRTVTIKFDPPLKDILPELKK